MTTEEVFTNILQQNEVIITLLARLVWTPEKLAAVVMANKRNPDAYVSIYNALDGEKTGVQLAALAGVTKQAISFVLQSWVDEGIVLNVGTDNQPKYRRLMRLPEKKKPKAKQDVKEVEASAQAVQETQETNGQ